jgi:fatty-acyl-CoA synthase
MTLSLETGDTGFCRVPLARTLPDLLREQALQRPHALAAATESERVTFGELHSRVARRAVTLRASGVRHGDRVGLLLGNGIEWLEIMFGATMAGAVAVPFSTWSTRSELEFLLADARPRILFAAARFGDRDFTEDLRALVPAGGTTEVIMLGGCADDRAAEAPLSPGDGLPPGDGPSAGDDAYILYTSGSTSRPKGVRLSHHAVVENGFNIGLRQGLREGDIVFMSAPLFWSFGSANALPAAFGCGAALALPARFEAGQALRMIRSLACTAIYTLPAMTAAILRHPDHDPGAVASLRTGVTIGAPQDFMAAVEGLGAPELCNIYGATETCGNCCVTDHRWPVERRACCQGEPLPGQRLRFRDPESGDLLPPGRTGLVEIAGFVSPGYAGDSAGLNATTFTEDGYYRSGDLGRLDEDGAFVFVGRHAEMIKRAGINVSPAEVEEALLQVQGVAGACVTGAPDEMRGELIVAFVTEKRPGTLTREALLAHCREHLSKYKHPDLIDICETLPKTATGKIRRKDLQERAAALVREKATSA